MDDLILKHMIKLVDIHIANGADGLLVVGSTGDGRLMTWEDQIMLIAHTVNSFGDKVDMGGSSNAGSNCKSEAIKATERGFAVGMDGALHINPYYGKTSLDGLVAHYNSVLSIGPCIIYNLPSRTAQDIPPSIVRILAKNPNSVDSIEKKNHLSNGDSSNSVTVSITIEGTQNCGVGPDTPTSKKEETEARDEKDAKFSSKDNESQKTHTVNSASGHRHHRDSSSPFPSPNLNSLTLPRNQNSESLSPPSDFQTRNGGNESNGSR